MYPFELLLVLSAIHDYVLQNLFIFIPLFSLSNITYVSNINRVNIKGSLWLHSQ